MTEPVAALRARLAHIEAWAARAIELFATFNFEPVNGPLVERVVGWPSSEAIGRHLREYPAPEHGNKTADAISATSSAGVLPTPGRDAPATSEGEVMPDAIRSERLLQPTDERRDVASGAAHPMNAGSAADAAADRLRAACDDNSLSAYTGEVRKADIRAVLDSRDAARDEAARLAAWVREARAALVSWQPNGTFSSSPFVVMLTHLLDTCPALAPASAAPATAEPTRTAEE